MSKSKTNAWGANAVLAGECLTAGATEFASRFCMTDSQKIKYQPLFLALVSSSSGEVATSFGLFKKDGLLWEVSGSECSMWDFNGQFVPEATTVDALKHRVLHGHLGRSDIDAYDCYGRDLLALLDSPEMVAIAAEPLTEQGKIAMGFILDDAESCSFLGNGGLPNDLRLDHAQIARLNAVFVSRAISAPSPVQCQEYEFDCFGETVYRFQQQANDYYLLAQPGGTVRFICFSANTTGAINELLAHRLVVSILWEEVKVSLEMGVDMVEDTPAYTAPGASPTF